MTIREIIEAVLGGRIRVPAFQRGFVWESDHVAFLMDSLYKKYPIGSLLFWRTKSDLRHEKQLGPFSLPDRDPDYPIDYVLDGQQRITSIFGVFQTDLSPVSGSDWVKIYFDFTADPDAQESQFVALPFSDYDPKKHFDISTFFDTIAYRRATESLSDETVKRIDEVQSVFKEARIPIQAIDTEDKATVAIIFERVNRQGVPLDTLQLLTAWTWSEEFDLQERFSELANELVPFGFKDVGENADLLLRCCAAVLARDVSPKTLIELNGSAVRDQFEEVINGVRGAIDFLRNNLFVYSMSSLPYSLFIVPLTVFFAAKTGAQVQISDSQRKRIERWFWRSCFTKRYSSGVLRKLKEDIDEIYRLRYDGESQIDAIKVQFAESFFYDNIFRINTVNTKTLVLLLAHNKPRSFVSGQNVSLEQVLSNYNRNEFHHLMPRAFLRASSQDIFNENVLANFVFMTASDNNQLGGVAPSRYRKFMPDNPDAILASAICPSSLFNDDYEPFIRTRSEMLFDYASRLMDIG